MCSLEHKSMHFLIKSEQFDFSLLFSIKKPIKYQRIYPDWISVVASGNSKALFPVKSQSQWSRADKNSSHSAKEGEKQPHGPLPSLQKHKLKHIYKHTLSHFSGCSWAALSLIHTHHRRSWGSNRQLHLWMQKWYARCFICLRVCVFVCVCWFSCI